MTSTETGQTSHHRGGIGFGRRTELLPKRIERTVESFIRSFGQSGFDRTEEQFFLVGS
jgi:hypothetical protein